MKATKAALDRRFPIVFRLTRISSIALLLLFRNVMISMGSIIRQGETGFKGLKGHQKDLTGYKGDTGDNGTKGMKGVDIHSIVRLLSSRPKSLICGFSLELHVNHVLGNKTRRLHVLVYTRRNIGREHAARTAPLATRYPPARSFTPA